MRRLRWAFHYLQGDGAGGFQLTSDDLVECGPLYLATADFDLDDAPEVAVTRSASVAGSAGEILFFAAEASGSFDEESSIPVAPEPRIVLAADLDDDGRPDLAVAHDGNAGLVVHLNTTGPPLPVEFIRGDLDADGVLGLPDSIVTLEFLFIPGTEVSCVDAVDVNDDGSLTLADAIAHLSWLFVPGSPAPAAPFPGCGDDPGLDELPPCESSGC